MSYRMSNTVEPIHTYLVGGGEVTSTGYLSDFVTCVKCFHDEVNGGYNAY